MLNRELLAYIPREQFRQDAEKLIFNYLKHMVEDMIHLAVKHVNSHLLEDYVSCDRINISSNDSEWWCINFKLGGKDLLYKCRMEETYLTVSMDGRISGNLYMIEGAMQYTMYDKLHICTSESEHTKIHLNAHIEAMKNIVRMITNNQIFTVFREGKEFLLSEYYKIPTNCICGYVPSTAQSHEQREISLKDVIRRELPELDTNDPFNKNSLLYFDCDGSHGYQTRQTIKHLTNKVFDIMIDHNRIKSNLEKYPILLARKCCHTVLLGYRRDGILSRLPKDVILLILHRVWESRYDLDEWF